MLTQLKGRKTGKGKERKENKSKKEKNKRKIFMGKREKKYCPYLTVKRRNKSTQVQSVNLSVVSFHQFLGVQAP